MEGSYIKLTNQNRDQTNVNVYKNISDDALSLWSLSFLDLLGASATFLRFLWKASLEYFSYK